MSGVVLIYGLKWRDNEVNALGYVEDFSYLCGMKSMMKYELAEAAGVSMRTFSRWLSRNEKILAQHGVYKNSRLIAPKGVRFICEEYGIDLEELRKT